MSDVWCPRPDVWCLMCDVWCLMVDIRCLLSDSVRRVRYMMSDGWCLCFDVRCPIFDVRSPMSDDQCLVSDVWLCDVRCLMSDVWCQMSKVWCPTCTFTISYLKANYSLSLLYQSINYWFNLFLLGFFLFLTPVYIIGEQPKLTGQNIGSAVFCFIIANQFLVFTFGIVSLYTVTLLAVERWFAVFRPLRYKTTFRPHRVQKYLVIIWLSSFAANSTHLLETKFLLHSKNETQRCVLRGIAGNESRATIGVVEICFKFFTPALILLVTFSHLYRFMRDSSVLSTTRRSHVVITRVTHMAAITSFAMVLCWFPNQLFYLLFKFNLVELNTGWHRATVILCMFNSCLNPCIFLLSNKFYRQKANKMLPDCRGLRKRGKTSLAEKTNVTESVVCVKFIKTQTMGEEGVEMLE